MARFWISILLLAALVAVGFWGIYALEQHTGVVIREVEQAAVGAAQENWELVRDRLYRARSAWEDRWHLAGSLLPHQVLDEADALLDQMELYLSRQEELSFQIIARRLLSLLRTLAEGQRITWWNLL